MLESIFALTLGLGFHLFQDAIGMASLEKGVEYYGEVHLSFWNSVIHTIFMPFTMYGMFIWIPSFLNLNPGEAFRLKKNVCLIYLGIYSRINPYITCLIMFVFSIPFILSTEKYQSLHQTRMYCIGYGLFFAVGALMMQEIVGHYIGGDDASRVEAIPNAIVYANYYSIAHLFSS